MARVCVCGSNIGAMLSYYLRNVVLWWRLSRRLAEASCCKIGRTFWPGAFMHIWNAVVLGV